MNCREYEGEIALLVSGDLPPERTREVESHAEGCAVCSGYREEMTGLLLDLSALPSTNGIAEELTRLRTNVARRTRRRSASWQVAAAAALVLAIAGQLWRQAIPREVETPQAMSRWPSVPENPITSPLPPLAVPAMHAARTQARAPKRGPVLLAMQKLADGQVEMRFASSDPKITLIWLQDSTEEINHDEENRNNFAPGEPDGNGAGEYHP